MILQYNNLVISCPKIAFTIRMTGARCPFRIFNGTCTKFSYESQYTRCLRQRLYQKYRAEQDPIQGQNIRKASNGLMNFHKSRNRKALHSVVWIFYLVQKFINFSSKFVGQDCSEITCKQQCYNSFKQHLILLAIIWCLITFHTVFVQNLVAWKFSEMISFLL